MKKNNYFSESSFWLRALIGVLVLVLGIGLVAVIAGDLISDTPDGNEEGSINTETEDAKGDPNCAHVFASEGEVIKAATCKDTGIMGYRCTLCGYVDKDNEIPKTDEHQYGAPKNNTKDGNHMYVCSNCGNETYENHDPKESTVAPTCTTKGAQIFSCVCGYVEKKDIDPTGHEIVERKQVTGDGGNHNAYCTNCMIVLSEKHTWSEESVVVEATCTESGLKRKTCTGCGYVKDTVIPSLGHSLVEDLTWEGRVAVTCEDEGKGRFVCEREDCSYSSEQSIPALGHKNFLAEMCGNPDTHELYCGVCMSYVKDESHSFTGAYEYVDENEHSRACNKCGQLNVSTHSLKKIGSVNKDDGYVWNRYSCECGYVSEVKTSLMWG